MIDRDAILAEIIEYTSPSTIEEDEFTVNDYRRACTPAPSRSTIQSRLNALVDQGLLESRLVLSDAKWCVAYRKVEGKWGDA